MGLLWLLDKLGRAGSTGTHLPISLHISVVGVGPLDPSHPFPGASWLWPLLTMTFTPFDNMKSLGLWELGCNLVYLCCDSTRGCRLTSVQQNVTMVLLDGHRVPPRRQ